MRVPSLARLLAGAILIVTVSTQPVFLLGAGFLRIGDELGFGPAGLGVLTAAFFLTASIASAPLGRVVERIGWQRAMRLNEPLPPSRLPMLMAIGVAVVAVCAAVLFVVDAS